MNSPISVHQLLAQAITPENFQAYGQVIVPTLDGRAFDMTDAQLHLSEGIPRFYIMRLQQRGRAFSRITRHQRCTQCLGALDGKSWFIAVAPPADTERPASDAIVAFQVPGNCFIKLEVGTWHAGPYFDPDFVDFYNLELSDTNLTDHQTCDLQAAYGFTFEII